MMRVVVIGSNGFIGTNLLQYLSSRHIQVIACDHRKPKKEIVGVVYHRVIGKESEFYRGIIQEDDYIILLKWKGVPVSAIRNQWELFQSNIVDMMLLIDVCVERKVKKIFFASSGGAVYGNKNIFPISEQEEAEPISEYGIQKLMIENYLRFISRTSKIPTVCLRIANPYGPYQHPFNGQGIIATFLASGLLGKNVEIWGDGNCLRDYLYIDDLCECIYRCLLLDIEEGIYNVGSSEGTSILEICELISAILGIELHRTVKPAYGVQVKNNVLDCSKIKEQIGWECEITMAEGISRMLGSWNGIGFFGKSDVG